MGIFDLFGKKPSGSPSGFIVYGPNKKSGGHDHRYNTGDDRTPRQKEGDRKRRKTKR